MCTEGEKHCLARCGTVFRKAVEPVQSGKFSSGRQIHFPITYSLPLEGNGLNTPMFQTSISLHKQTAPPKAWQYFATRTANILFLHHLYNLVLLAVKSQFSEPLLPFPYPDGYLAHFACDIPFPDEMIWESNSLPLANTAAHNIKLG